MMLETFWKYLLPMAFLLRNSLCSPTPRFLIGLFVFGMFNFLSSLYALITKPLLYEEMAEIFSHSGAGSSYNWSFLLLYWSILISWNSICWLLILLRAIGVLFRKLPPMPTSWIVFPTFYSKSFKNVLGLILNSLTYLELLLLFLFVFLFFVLCRVRDKNLISFFYRHVSSFLKFFFFFGRCCLFSDVCFWHLFWKPNGYSCMVLCLGPLSVLLMYMSDFCASAMLFLLP